MGCIGKPENPRLRLRGDMLNSRGIRARGTIRLPRLLSDCTFAVVSPRYSGAVGHCATDSGSCSRDLSPVWRVRNSPSVRAG